MKTFNVPDIFMAKSELNVNYDLFLFAQLRPTTMNLIIIAEIATSIIAIFLFSFKNKLHI